jgi:hypothetical protein
LGGGSVIGNWVISLVLTNCIITNYPITIASC